jgi:hypothetical protein
MLFLNDAQYFNIRHYFFTVQKMFIKNEELGELK